MSNIDHIEITSSDPNRLRDILKTAKMIGDVSENPDGISWLIEVNSYVLGEQVAQLEKLTQLNPEITILAEITCEYDRWAESSTFDISEGSTKPTGIIANYLLSGVAGSLAENYPQLKKLEQKAIDICRRLDIQKQDESGSFYIDRADCEAEIIVEADGLKARYRRAEYRLDLIELLRSREVTEIVWEPVKMNNDADADWPF
jgi:hypothetical protein